MRPPSATPIDDHESGNPDRIEQMRGYLMVVATVITTITYQPALRPPGGVWQTANQSIACCDEAKCEAGTLVFAYGNSEFVFLCYLICNSIAFTASLCVIFLLISGFPLKNKCLMVLHLPCIPLSHSWALHTYWLSSCLSHQILETNLGI
ncbi:hypothetical protein CMV_024392 [Castanea mollissima]|nr:hypothetical protein CMV_024392 [Castanea mollissima]